MRLVRPSRMLRQGSALRLKWKESRWLDSQEFRAWYLSRYAQRAGLLLGVSIAR